VQRIALIIARPRMNKRISCKCQRASRAGLCAEAVLGTAITNLPVESRLGVSGEPLVNS